MDAHCSGVRKGAWTSEEDRRLKKCVEKYGARNWCQVPARAGLNRCRKSCRLRWTNYINPGIKRGSFEEDEQDLIIRLHKLLGNRWSLIAGRLPGRTANDIKNYWNSHLSKKSITRDNEAREHAKIIKPKPWTVFADWIWSSDQHETENKQAPASAPAPAATPGQPELALPSEDRATMNKELPNKVQQNHDSFDIEHIMMEDMGSDVMTTIDNAFESGPSDEWDDLLSDVHLWEELLLP